MKNLYLLSGAVLLYLTLFACAGSQGASPDSSVTDNSEQEVSTDVEALENQPVMVWKTETVIFKYIDGTIDKTIANTYNDEGQQLVSEETDGQGELQLVYKSEYRQGVLMSKETSDKTGLLSRTLYEMNTDGRIVRQVKQDSEGTTLSIISNTYNGDLLISSIAFDENEIPNMNSLYSYQDGELLSIEYQLPDGSEEARLERTIENGLVREERVLLPDGSVETSREFDYSDGRLTSETYYSNNVKIKSVQFEYDDKENISREVWSDRKDREYEVIERSWKQFEMVK